MKNFAPRRCFAQCLCLLMGVFVLVTGVSAQRTALAMRAPAMPAGSVDLGALPASQPMKLTLYLSPSADRQAALVSFLKGLQTPGGAAYHAWLTPAQFGQRFGASVDQLAAINAFAQRAGLSVESASASGLRVVVSGTAAQVEATFAPGMHAFRVADKIHFANTASASLPLSLASNIVAIGGLSDVPSAQPMTVATDGMANAIAVQDALKAIGDVAEANTARLLTLSTASCLEDVDKASQSAMQLALRQASAQGITVLAATGCGPRGSAGFPSVLSEATSVAIAPGITPPATANLIEARPSWQLAMGLPADALRHEPDLTTSSLSAFAQTMMAILAKQPASADGSAPRLGNINATLYQLATEPGLYTQPDNAAAGTWEVATGLGLVDLQKLEKFYPHGSLSVNVSLNVSNGGYVVHGQSLTFSSTVTDTSGQGGGAVPGGTVTFSTTSGVALGTGTLSGGSASVTYNQLPGGSYTAQAQYSGDGTYASNTSVSDGFSVGPEAAQVTGSAGSGSVGGTIPITITVKSTSGIGTPSGTATVAPQGTSDTTQYSGTLNGSGGTASAVVSVAAVQGGADVFNVNCTTDASFTCYSPQSVTAQVSLGTPTMTLTANPTSPTNGQTDTLSVVVAGKGGIYPVPAGNMNFYDNGIQLGSATLNNGSANFTTQPLTGSSHSFSATYGGNNNYATVTVQAGASGTSPASSTSTLLTITPTSPVSGNTTVLTATISYTLTNNSSPSGSVKFYQNGILLATQPVSGGTAQYSSTTLNSTATYQYDAVYSGDSNYLTSTSPIVTTSATGAIATTTTLAVNPNPPVLGSTTTLTATVTHASGTATPTGTVTFYQDGNALTTAAFNGSTSIYTTAALSTTTTHVYTATYTSGDSNYAGSTSAPVTATPNTSTGTVTSFTDLSVTPNPPVSGTTTTLMATVIGTFVAGATPSGAVTFFEDGVSLGSASLINQGTTANPFMVATLSSSAITGTAAHSFTATYAGNSTFASSTSSAVATTASGSLTPTSLTLTLSPNPPSSGSTATLTGTITTTGTATPTGTITLYYDDPPGGLALNVVTVTGKTVTLETQNGNFFAEQIFNAVYSGDSNYTASTSPNLQISATQASTTIVASVASTSVTAGGTDVLTATLTPASTVNGAAPSGTVTFTSAQGTLCSGNISGTTFSCTATLSATGTQTITASYGGDNNYLASVSTNAPIVTVNASSSTGTVNSFTDLTVSPNPPVSGNTTTLMATVIGSFAAGASPSGTVTFFEDGVSLGTAFLINQGGTVVPFMVATLSSAAITGTAAHSFTATYAGNATFAGSTSSPVSTAASGSLTPTSLALSLSPNPPVSGSTATLTGTITTSGTATPTGTITLYYDDPPGGLPIASATVTGKTVTLLTQNGALFDGNLYNAIYSGDSNYTASTSPNLQISTTQASTTTTASVASTSVATGGTDVLTATVTPASTVNGTPPTGTVTFSSSQGTLCSGSISGTTFSCTATLTAAGTQAITATYGGDNNYLASASTNAPTVTVGSSTTNPAGALTVSASPSVSVMYGATITLSSTLTPTSAITSGSFPSGTITFTLTGAGTVTYTAALTAVSSSEGMATYAIPTPPPGTYVLTATCTSSNVTCTGLSATSSITVIKGNTVTTLVASPTSPLAGETTTFTATVTPATTPNAAATPPTGTVSFFVNGVATQESLINGVATFNTVLTATTGNFVTAVYSGDTNWNGSSSSQLDVIIAPTPTTSSMTANETTALYTANIVFTDAVTVAPTTLTPYPPAPVGTVTFYDLYNGQTTLLGTASLTTVVPGDSIAQFSTTGLLKGTHLITALFNANTTFASSTATITINITDYAVTFSPQTLSLSAGSGGSAIATITPYNGFSGQVVLGCTPPAGDGMTCSFAPAVITVGGTSILSITTTAAKASLTRPTMGKGATAVTLAAVSFGTLLLGLLLPRKRRLPAVLLALLAALVVGGSMGCTTQGILNTQSTGGGSGGSGTPLGTQLLSITTQGSDGATTVRHDTQYQVTVQ